MALTITVQRWRPVAGQRHPQDRTVTIIERADYVVLIDPPRYPIVIPRASLYVLREWIDTHLEPIKPS